MKGIVFDLCVCKGTTKIVNMQIFSFFLSYRVCASFSVHKSLNERLVKSARKPFAMPSKLKKLRFYLHMSKKSSTFVRFFC